MAIKLGQLIIELTAKSDAFAKGMTDMRDLTFTSAQGMISSLEKVGATISKLKFENSAQLKRSFDIVSEAAAGLAIGGITGAASGLALIAERSITSGAKLYDLSQSTGVAVETLSSFSYIAKQSGIDTDSMAKALERFSKNAFQSATGTGTAAKAFSALGISVLDANKQLKPVTDLVEEVAAKFAGMKDGTEKTGIAMELFGRTGATLIPMLNRGKEGIADFTAEAQRLGVVISTDTAAKEKLLDESLQRLRTSLEGAGTQITVGMVPALTELSAAFTGSARDAQTWRDVGEGVGFILRQMALDVNEFAEAFAKIGAFNAGLKAKFGITEAQRAAGQETKAYYDSLIAQAESARDRINAITQNAPTLGIAAHGGTGAAPAIEDAKNLTKEQNKLADSMKELGRIANELQLKGQDPLTKAMLDYGQTLEKISDLQNGFPAQLQKTAEYEIAVREAEQDRGIALKALNRELDKLANDSGKKALDLLSKESRLPSFNLGPIAGPVIPTLNPDVVGAKIQEMTRNFRVSSELFRQMEDEGLTAAQNLQIKEAELQLLLEKQVISQQQYNKLKAQAVELAKQQQIQELLGPQNAKNPMAGATAAVLDWQLQNQNAAQNVYSAMTGAFQGIEQSFQQAFAGIINGTETLGQAFRNLGVGILSSIGNALAQMLAQWITTHIIMAAFSKLLGVDEAAVLAGSIAANNTANVAKGVSAAGLAAANTFAWWSAVFPPSAPGMAAAAYAEGLGFASLSSFDVGGMVPKDMVARVHEGERVLTPNQNRDLFDRIRSPQADNGGATHLLTQHIAAQASATSAMASEIGSLRGEIKNLNQRIRLIR